MDKFCSSCGSEIKSGLQYCNNCGSKQESNMNQINDKPKIDKKGNVEKKDKSLSKSWINFSLFFKKHYIKVAIFVIAIFLSFSIFLIIKTDLEKIDSANNSKIHIDLGAYSEILFTGESGSGKIKDVRFDSERFLSQYPDLKNNYDDIVYLEKNPSTTLKNGDIIDIEVRLINESKMSKKYEFDNDVQFKVSGLTKIISFNNTFIFDGFSITFLQPVSFAKVENRYSEYNGSQVAVVKMRITNNTAEKNTVNMYYYDVYGPSKQEKLNVVTAYFSNDSRTLDFGADILPGTTVDRNMYFLYEGPGKYLLYFDNYIEEVLVQLDI